jgi:hypothetical protein
MRNPIISTTIIKPYPYRIVPNPSINAAIEIYNQGISFELARAIRVESGFIQERRTINSVGNSHANGCKIVCNKIWSNVVATAVPMARPMPRRSGNEGFDLQLVLSQIDAPVDI